MTKQTKKTKRSNALKSKTTLEGTMTFAKNNDNLNIMDFACCEEGVQLTPFMARCKVQAMRDGNVYITELKKRVRNKPLMRTDNASLSLGHDQRYYFIFSLDASQMSELPDELAYQALKIADRFEEKYLNGKEEAR